MNVCRIRMILALSLAAILGLFWWKGAEWVGNPLFLPESTIQARSQSALFVGSVADQVDRILNLLLSLLVGVFIFSALSMQRLGAKARISVFHLMAGLVLVGASFFAAYFIYAARLHTLTLVEYGYIRFDGVLPLIGRAAFFVALVAASAMMIAADSVLSRRNIAAPAGLAPEPTKMQAGADVDTSAEEPVQVSPESAVQGTPDAHQKEGGKNG